MKNIKIAIFALTTALAASPLAFGGPIPFSLTLTPTAGDVELTGTSLGGIVQDGGNFIQTVTNSGHGETSAVGASFNVLAPVHEHFMGTGVENDNTFVNTENPFSANGLLIELTSGTLSGDFVYINGIGGLDSNQIDVSVFTSLTSGQAISTINYFVTNNDIPKTPEPSSMLLLGTGLLSLAGLVFWKSKSSGSSLPALTL